MSTGILAMHCLSEMLLATFDLCKAGGEDGNHPNYNKPHVWIEGQRDGETAESCRFCGRWKEELAR